MLIDDLLSHKTIEGIIANDKWPKFRTKLTNAVKFDLAPDFATSAEELAQNYDTISHAIPFCRLPYPCMWFELAQQHRPAAAGAPIHSPETQGVPHRIGFLLENRSSTVFMAHQFWLIKGQSIPYASHIAMRYDPAAAQPVIAAGIGMAEIEHETRFFDIKTAPQWIRASPLARAALAAIIMPSATEFNHLLVREMANMYPVSELPRVFPLLYEVGATDWAGEVVYLLSVLALLNTVNATESVRTTPSPKLNRARVKNGKAPLLEHYTLTIHPRIKARMTGPKGEGKGDYTMNWARGHFKVRRTGIFWWSPHIRGSFGKPTKKDYRVE